MTAVTDAEMDAADTGDVGPVADARESKEVPMKANVGGIDRVLRAVLGAILIGLTLSGAIGAWGWIGLVLLGTAAVGFCPLYPLIGLNTCRASKT